MVLRDTLQKIGLIWLRREQMHYSLGLYHIHTTVLRGNEPFVEFTYESTSWTPEAYFPYPHKILMPKISVFAPFFVQSPSKNSEWLIPEVRWMSTWTKLCNEGDVFARGSLKIQMDDRWMFVKLKPQKNDFWAQNRDRTPQTCNDQRDAPTTEQRRLSWRAMAQVRRMYCLCSSHDMLMMPFNENIFGCGSLKLFMNNRWTLISEWLITINVFINNLSWMYIKQKAIWKNTIVKMLYLH